MNQLRSSDLFRYKQNFQQHKQKVKSIMNRSSQSIQQLTQKQRMMLSKNNLSHQRAMKFKLQQKQRHINFVNSNFVNRIYHNEKKREKLFDRQLANTSGSGDMLRGKVMSHLARSPGQKGLSSSRTLGDLQRGNSFLVKRINEVKSTISLRQFNKEYSRHQQRSSMISKFKVDARSFKFIPKNQIMLEKINRARGVARSERGSVRGNNTDKQTGFITERVQGRVKQSVKQKPKSRTSQSLMKLNIPVKSLGLNIKLQQLKVNQKKPLQQPASKYSTLMILSNPQKSISSSVRKWRVNN